MGSVESIAFSPDGRFLASGSSDGTVKIWNLANGAELRTLTGHTDIVTAVAFSPNGQLLATASRDKTVRLWNPGTGKKLWGQPGQESVAFSPDGSLLATGGDLVRLFKIAVEE